jgi:hypothetical protein
LLTFDPEDLINRTFLTDPNEDGERFRAKVVRQIIDTEKKNRNDPDFVKFLVSHGPECTEEILGYNEVLDYVEEQIQRESEPDGYWQFTKIIDHYGNLTEDDPKYKGSTTTVLVRLEDGSQVLESLDVIAKDNPVICAQYAKEKDLLYEPGCRRFRRFAKTEKKLHCLINQAKLKSFREADRYKFGYKVPTSEAAAFKLDQENGNTLWKDAMTTELTKLHEYSTFRDLGKNAKAPKGYLKI